MSKPNFNEGEKHGNKRNVKGKGKQQGKYSRSKVITDRSNERRKCDIACSGDINDASYYFIDDNLKRQVTNISFNQFNGVNSDMGQQVNQDGTTTQVYDGVPYIMRITVSPSAGFTSNTDYSALGNGVNLAALNLYTELSANNAKTTNYAPQDLTTLLLALGSVIELSSYITRFFGMTSLYNYRNRAFPKAMIEAAGCDYEDLIANLAEYRIRFNNDLVSAARIPVPANIRYLTKCSEMYQGLYQDMAGSPMAQLYLLAPGSVWELDETYSDEGTGLKTVQVLQGLNPQTPYLTMAALLDRFEDMLGALLNSATLNAIYSDILRVSTKEGMPLMQFEMVDESYAILPAYKPEIRLWINNLTVMGYPLASSVEGIDSTTSNDVAPAVAYNRIKYAPLFKFESGTASLNSYINFDYENPDSDDIVYATRLKAAAKLVAKPDGFYSTAVALPDHYVNELMIFRSSGVKHVIQSSFEISVSNTFALSSFDWYPIVYAGSGADFSSIGDLNYYTTVDFDYLKRLQDTTYLGLLTIR